MPVTGRRSRRLFYGWYVVSCGFIFLALGYGARYSFSVFFPELVQQFGWPRDLTGSILSTHLLAYGSTAPLAGYLVDKWGARRTMLLGTGLLCTGIMTAGFGSQPWHFYLTFGLIAGVGLCLLASVPLTVIIRNWFERRRGTAISILFFGEGCAYATYPAVVWLIQALSWRKALWVEGLLIAAVFIPVIFFVIRSHPSKKGLFCDGRDIASDDGQPDAAEAARIVDQAWAARDWNIRAALKTGRFYLVCITTFCIWGVCHHLLVTHQIAFAIDVGYEPLEASAIMALGGWFFALGSLLSAFSDRFGREWVITLGSVLVISSVIALVLVKDTTTPFLVYYYSIIFGLGFGMCVPTIAAAVTDIFQGESAGAVIGLVWFAFALGGGLGPWLGGWLFELGGHYRAAFITAGIVQAIGCLTIWWAGPSRVRSVPGRTRLKTKEMTESKSH